MCQRLNLGEQIEPHRRPSVVMRVFAFHEVEQRQILGAEPVFSDCAGQRDIAIVLPLTFFTARHVIDLVPARCLLVAMGAAMRLLVIDERRLWR
jgi:hypothetical protein